MTNVRLAWNFHPGVPRALIRLAYHPEGGKTLTDIRLAHCPGAQGDNVLVGQRGVKKLPPGRRPGLLVSYVYLATFLKNQDKYAYRDWVLDSGAFSAHNSGKEINLYAYMDKCKELMAEDPTLVEVYALDVIGDWKASLKNCETMWEHDIPAIPTFHVGSPEHVLITLAKEYPKIALGGSVGYRGKIKWAEQCFARVWPKKIHGFGFGGEKAIMVLPWHSVDATNWEIQPCKYGSWNSFGRMSIRGSNQDLRAEVEWHLKLEDRARKKWGPVLAELDTGDFSVRLAVVNPKRDDALRKTSS